jgi:hypothetical protein
VSWYPDERDHAGPEHLDPGYVAGYDAKTQLDLEQAHVRDEHSTFSWLRESLFEHAAFEIVDRHVRGGIYATYVRRRQ